ncbi:Cytochrome P450, conserved site,Cytochrome P450,Cytochrome P450, E-class, group I [Cinara cedri]|uniref:Cytochrome P450, conserved site,Cytochrome P450,Cytochrome P450, E-class, group I n=1 Tax=Cinara cedri TaxID=506608 RepID=A0A5E4MNV7_9HEMI|nr:Cytochrome P450, conserved site,Cytochrome P450,Cytochrome P450, E-class, group I [Cinara cedri]
MFMCTLILTCVAVTLIAVVVSKRLKFIRAFRTLPGPPALPLFGNALQLNGSPSDFFRLLLKWHEQFGNTYQLWIGLRPFVAMADSEHIQQILNSSIHIDKNLEYNLLIPFIGTGLVTSSGTKWHTRRKLLTPTFHFSILEEFLPSIEKQSKIFVKVLRKELSTTGFDIKPYAKLVALDIIGNTAMGCEFNTQENSQLEYVKALDELTAIMQKRFITPWLKSEFLFNFTTLSKRQNACINVIHTFTKKVIKEKKENFKMYKNQTSDANKNDIHYKKKSNKALLECLLDVVSDDGKILSDEDIQEEVDTFMFAGVDTSSSTISWILYTLGKYPEAQDRILEELDEKLPNFGNQTLSTIDLASLDYLERTIKEVQRLYPSVPYIGRQIYEQLTIDEHTILPGTSIFINVFALHRNAKYFPNPEKFDPDRFLKVNRNEQNPYSFIPFSAGPRNCIGQKFAMNVLKITIATFLKSYKVRSLDPEDKLGLVSEIVLNALNGIKLTIEERV